MKTELEVGLQVRNLLDQSAQQLPASIQARLDEAVRLSVAASQAAKGNASFPYPAARAHWFSKGLDWLGTQLVQPSASFAVSLCFVVAAGMGVVLEIESRQEQAIIEIVELDAAILSDDLPTDAWLDSGFVGYSSTLPNRVWQEELKMKKWLEQLNQEQPNT